MRARAFRGPHLRPPPLRAEDLPELLLRAQRSEPDAVQALLRFLGPLVRRVAVRAARRYNADADDLAQEVWLCLLRRRWAPFARYDPAQGSLERYARGVLQKLAWAAARARRVRAEGHPGSEEQAATSFDLMQQVEARELWSRFLLAVAEELPPIGRAVVALLAEGESPQQIARRLECRPQVVYSWTYKARRLAAVLAGARWRSR